MLKRSAIVFTLLILAAGLAGCPKPIPQPEIDAANASMKDLEATRDCAPELYQAARTMMDKAQALLKEEKYDEARTAFLAAKQLADKARAECDRKRKEEEERKRLEAEQKPAEPASREIPVESGGPEALVTVHFGFNDSTLSDEARETLNNDAEFLRRRPALRIRIEGHCDNRGSTEYNLALGERRAQSVRAYLVKLGIDPARLDFLSYGEEQPVDPANSEDAWAKNRRGEFVELK